MSKDPFADLAASPADNKKSTLEAKRLAKELRGLADQKSISKDRLRELLTQVSIHGIAQALEDGSEKSMLDWSKLLSAQTGLTKVVEAVDDADLDLKRALHAAAEQQNGAR